MLVVELDALGRVDALDVLDERVHRRLDVGELAQVAEVDEAARDLVAGANVAAVHDAGHEAGGGGDGALVEHAARVIGVEDADEVAVLLGLDGELARQRRQVGLATEDLLVHVTDDVEHAADRRQALRDVVGTGDAAGVNRAHRELRTRLADGLGGNDAHRGAHVDRTTRGEVPAVALLADAVLGAAGQQGAELDLLEAGVEETLDVLGALDVAVLGDEHLAGLGGNHVVEDAAADEVDVELEVGVVDRLLKLVGDALGGAAVLLAHDDVLCHVDESTGEVTGVGRVRGGVDEALTSAVRRDEVLERQQALTEVRLDG